MTQIKGLIHSTESFGSVDGPGVRFIIFVQGCPLRCQFCHNPDTWNMTDKNGATWRSADELLAQALRYRTYWKNGGGITVSGGEPLLQIDFLLDLFKKAKAKGIHTTIDTAGGPFTREEPFFSKFQELMQYTDLLLVDIKHIDEKSHKELTGKTNKNILDMTYAELCQYPIIYGRNAAMFPNNVVPTLKQYIDCCNTYNMTPVIEIKQIPSANGMKQF